MQRRGRGETWTAEAQSAAERSRGTVSSRVSCREGEGGDLNSNSRGRDRESAAEPDTEMRGETWAAEAEPGSSVLPATTAGSWLCPGSSTDTESGKSMEPVAAETSEPGFSSGRGSSEVSRLAAEAAEPRGASAVAEAAARSAEWQQWQQSRMAIAFQSQSSRVRAAESEQQSQQSAGSRVSHRVGRGQQNQRDTESEPEEQSQQRVSTEQTVKSVPIHFSHSTESHTSKE